MAFTAQNTVAQVLPQLTSSVTSIDLGTVQVNDVVPVEFDLNLLNLGSITPGIANLQVESKQRRVRVGDVVALPAGTVTWEVDTTIEPLGAGALAGEALEVSLEVPIPLLPSITLSTEIPVTGTVVP
ncbi:hypothetical protein [Bacteroides reticulotermitis]|uniref:hypothetical protein n=1 Tax=Bacteroides reticulotermitis TaxID=1133319 RepID=UPI003A8C3458